MPEPQENNALWIKDSMEYIDRLSTSRTLTDEERIIKGILRGAKLGYITHGDPGFMRLAFSISAKHPSRETDDLIVDLAGGALFSNVPLVGAEQILKYASSRGRLADPRFYVDNSWAEATAEAIWEVMTDQVVHAPAAILRGILRAVGYGQLSAGSPEYMDLALQIGGSLPPDVKGPLLEGLAEYGLFSSRPLVGTARNPELLVPPER